MLPIPSHSASPGGKKTIAGLVRGHVRNKVLRARGQIDNGHDARATHGTVGLAAQITAGLRKHEVVSCRVRIAKHGGRIRCKCVCISTATVVVWCHVLSTTLCMAYITIA